MLSQALEKDTQFKVVMQIPPSLLSPILMVCVCECVCVCLCLCVLCLCVLCLCVLCLCL